MATVAIDQVTATTARLTASGLPSGWTAIDFQLSTDPDFEYAVDTFIANQAAAQITVTGLNQDTVYFVRSRAHEGVIIDPWDTVIEGFRTLVAGSRDLTPKHTTITPALIALPARPMNIQTSYATAGYPADNLFRDSPVSYRYSVPNTNGVPTVMTMDIDLAGQAVDTIALLATNLPEDAQWTLLSSPVWPYGNDSQTLIFDWTAFRASPNLPGRPGYHGVRRFPKTTARSFRLGIRSSQRWVVLTHLIMGLGLQSKNYSVDKEEKPQQGAIVARMRSGNADRQSGFPIRAIDFDISFVREEVYEPGYQQLMGAYNKAALVIPNTKDGPYLHDRIAYGDLARYKVDAPSSVHFTMSIGVNSII